MKEAKRLKEFLEDYDDDRDDPKYYRWLSRCALRSEWRTSGCSHLSSPDFSSSPSGAALCRSDFATERRRPSWTIETGRGRRRSMRRSDRGFWLKVTLTPMLSCRGWVGHLVYIHFSHSLVLGPLAAGCHANQKQDYNETWEVKERSWHWAICLNVIQSPTKTGTNTE